MTTYTVTPIHAFQDNYIWAIAQVGVPSIWVVDPGEAEPVLAYLAEHNLHLNGILITHHHADHRGGVAALRQRFMVPVYGPKHPDIDATVVVQEGDDVWLTEADLSLRVLAIPGHTLEHVAYYHERQHWLFCGDTLFSAGCGRIFEGTPTQMFASLAKLAALPAETVVYCAHEYTAANLRFALAVEPNNPHIRAKISEVAKLRQQKLPTLPSVLDLEKTINPFLRSAEPEVIRAAEAFCGHALTSPKDVFTVVRQWKDGFCTLSLP